jgi:hypothetical protein
MHLRRRFPFPAMIAAAAAWLAAPPLLAQSWLPPSPFPSWGAAPPANVTTLSYDPSLSPTANGNRLHQAIGALGPGHGLALGPGTWSVTNRLDLNGSGTAAAPIWLFAANPAQRPVITRPDASQNAINVGSNAPARHWVLRDLEITGGSDLLRLYDCAHVWIDRCWLHDGNGVGIAAMTANTDHLYVTRNEIARPGPGTNGEGMYFGGNNGSVVTSWTVIAFNHVHDTRGAVAGQGDGIEVKQGSHHVWVLGNDVHDCRNPCILVYGTNGAGENVVEGNRCRDSDDVVLQVQGEAIVRNNVALGGTFAFSSHDHQGQSRDCRVVHNTFVNAGPAASMQSWNARPNMVFANNVVYSLTGQSIRFGNGSAGVQLAGNVVLGPTYNATTGFVAGTGLQDFENLSVAGWQLDGRPVRGGALDNRGHPAFAVATDLTGAPRELPVDPGAFANAATLHASTAQLPVAAGGTQVLSFAAPRLAGASYHVVGSVTGATPGTALGAFVVPVNVDFWTTATLQQPNAGPLQNTRGMLDGAGSATAAIVVPPLPAALQGLTFRHALVALQNGAATFVSNTVPLALQ